jgi:hypothetical protein
VDCAWLLYSEISHLEVVNQYLKAQGVSNIKDLPWQTSKDRSLPITSISPANHFELRQLVANIIDDMREYCTSNGKPAIASEKCRKDMYKMAHSPLRLRYPRNMLNSTEYIQKFEAFTEILRSGQYDPALQPMLPGYVEYCVIIQQDLEEAFLFPPGIHLNTQVANGREVLVTPTGAQSRTQETIQAQNQLIYNVYNGRAEQIHHELLNGIYPSHGRGGRYRGCGRRSNQCAEEQHAMQALIHECLHEACALNKGTCKACTHNCTPRVDQPAVTPEALQEEHHFSNQVLNNHVRASPVASRNTMSSPSGLSHEDKSPSGNSVPSHISEANVPLPESPAAESMDVDDGTQNKGKDKGKDAEK